MEVDPLVDLLCSTQPPPKSYWIATNSEVRDFKKERE